MASKLLTAALVLACVAGAAAQSLKTDITSFRNNDPVTVTVTNPSPGTNDVVALYFAGAQPDTVKPLKVSRSPTCPLCFAAEGSGKFRSVLPVRAQLVQQSCASIHESAFARSQLPAM